ncbi:MULTISPECIES: GNAT family N-acetyltransferase [Bradyrhizobium]|jgi:CelD/BcsL family acetyltransferase involved in cellulose biosynthesis|uniref:Acetyltransferase involved in cellulose biosynthesis, CelD/BcsL family n=2 Tax=Bradyrhizobium TaxID=374 RepID=A0ABY0QEW2_9BRAD|nr:MULTISPECIES: GNAT family N-acetyltransferase [Bradyrhizobium]SDK08982.1 Acetyltransferase involved in cellulose biosynthesis, CelD/BcsL family [Bradyrhizobium ottawaense]SEE76406.1 Acetyltransferase involved in cellulose biosynthesis, CelD/BcsL family [Bradyrhizobium lablabi]SHM55377.1 Acetyltransferase involved in cellulose biosynthesis, CelD/BcsL family [Bradyrhizobium lablabi]
MTMAAAIDNGTADTWPKSGRIAGIDIVHDLASAEAVWRGLENQQASFTPYQRFDFVAAWQRQVGEREGLVPFIVIGHDAERRPLLLLPLALRHAYGARCAGFMGGKHSTFNMALWDRDFAASATQADLEGLISAIAQRAEADVFALHQQPLRWRDLPNPLALLPHQPSANDCPVLTMEPGAAPATLVSNSFRRRLKGKERKLQSLPGYRYHVASTEADATRLLDWFFRVKPLRMAEQKLPNVFADPGIEDFIRLACTTPLPNGHHVIDIHALECDEEVIAIFAGVADDYRFSMMFNTYTMSASAKYSPGLILMRDIIDHYAAQDYRALDLGIGSDDYKRLFCKDDEPIFDSFIALSQRGKLAAGVMSGLNRTKRLVKHNPALLGMAQKLRNAFS